ncbi:carbon-nitrogen hydrolase family protein [Rhodospirillaceae bacterium SYSU D60014]|uniref:carbon-nitrogen hydrolase family protein n=1 Tax=Virgifigura deserti TaxID=2268457 RepID=UPI000E67488D
MNGSFTVACVQNCAERDMAPSIAAVTDLIRGAAAAGATLIVLPEMVTMIEPQNALVLEKAVPEAADPGLAAFRDLARETGAWILVGSLLLKESGRSRVVNRSFLLDGEGAIVARYDKLHLFDIDLEEGESYRESATVQPGDRAVLAPTPWGLLGMSVCYDVRFAYLYRALAQAGASFLSIPAAFTYTTGKAHWHVLVRARAIETGSYVFAATQSGTHAEGRRTFGHSLIVDPWGEVLADAGSDVGFITAEIDPAKVAAARSMIPALRHDRRFAEPDAPVVERVAGA